MQGNVCRQLAEVPLSSFGAGKLGRGREPIVVRDNLQEARALWLRAVVMSLRVVPLRGRDGD
eukprot:717696-Amphidinium_carterae.3